MMIKDWIAEYKPQNTQDTLSALREIMQEVTLAALSRTDFFEKAAFYGGTALRIFYDLDRFSEDLDFSLLEANTVFRSDRNQNHKTDTRKPWTVANVCKLLRPI